MTKKVGRIFGSVAIIPLISSVIAILHFFIVGYLCTDKSFLVSCSRISREENVQSTESKILTEILKTDLRGRPKAGNITDSEENPTNVGVRMVIRSISELDDVKMEFKVQLTLRCFWDDHRLQYNDESGKVPYLTVRSPSSVWVPDLFFRNEKDAQFHNILQPNTYLRIYPDGKVFYSTRLSVTLMCPMNLKLLPFDVQRCQLPLASFSLTSKDLVLSWKGKDSVEVSDVLLLKVFTLDKINKHRFVTETETGIYSCLDVDLIFKREFAYYQIMIYIPCSMLVILSWITFWFDGKCLGSKVGLGIAVLLTMTILTYATNQSLPRVSYTKAIDVWTGVSLTFVFAVLLEITLISYFLSLERNQVTDTRLSEEEESGDKSKKPEDRNLPLEENEKVERNKRTSYTNEIQALILSKMPSNWSSRIDFISRIAFPVFFAIFVIAYFSTYRNANIDDWDYPIHSSVKEQDYTYNMEV